MDPVQEFKRGDRVRNIWVGTSGTISHIDEVGIWVDWDDDDDYFPVEPQDLEYLDPRQVGTVPDTFPTEWLGKWRRFAAGEAYPANYTPDDPYDHAGKQPLYDRLQTNWWELPEDQQRQAVVNAFRSTIISPQLELKWNAIVYQLLTQIPAEESDPDVFEQFIRDYKRRWDNPGQVGFDTPAENVMDPS